MSFKEAQHGGTEASRLPAWPKGPSPVVPAAITLIVWPAHSLIGNVALGALSLPLVALLSFGSTAVVLLGVKAVNVARSGISCRQTLASSQPLASARLGIFGFTASILTLYFGFTVGSPVVVNVLASAWPILVAAWLAFREPGRSTLTVFAFAALGLAGFLVTLAADGGPQWGGGLLGYAAGFMSSVCMAYYSVASRGASAPPLDSMIVGAVAGAVIAAVWALAAHVAFSPNVYWLAALYTGVGVSACGFLAWGAAMRRSNGRLAPLGFTSTLASTLLLIAFGYSTGGLLVMVGSGLILLSTAGVLLVERVVGRAPVIAPAKP
jgi:drug/metabolite transporter (DMT)-like permease